ncbi:MAG: GntR family transcriptional regulator [Parvibaculaceae bacterium]
MKKPPGSKFLETGPKPRQIAEILKRQVVSTMDPGTKLASENSLAKEFGVSRDTIRQALSLLLAERLITRTHGRGSFVAKRLPAASSKLELGAFSDASVRMNFRLVSNALTKATGEVAEFLDVPADDVVVHIVRSNLVGQDVVSYHEAFLPTDVGLRVLQEDLEKFTVAYLLQNNCGYEISEDQQILDADICDHNLARHLAVPMGFPVLVMRRVYLAPDNRPIVFFRSYYRSDRFRYTVAVQKHEGHHRVVPFHRGPNPRRRK